MESTTAQHQTNRLPMRVFAIVILLALTTCAIITYSLHTGYNMSSRYPPLVDATMEIKLEATTAHLWFEEILAGDPNEQMTTVYYHLDQAIWYTNAMLEGGENLEGHFTPLVVPELRNEIRQVKKSLIRFKKITQQRALNAQVSAAGSRVDGEYDLLFHDVINKADDIETALQQLLARHLQRFQKVQWLLITLVLLMMLLSLRTFYRYERHKIKTMTTLQQANEQLEKLSNTDGLTGCYNRRNFDSYLQQEWDRAQRDQHLLTLVLFDLDHFKAYNDLYGHPAGDYCLQLIVSTIKPLLQRPADRLFRYGGEEFALILPNTSEGQRLAENCRQQIATLQLEHRGNDHKGYLTISAGVANCMPTAASNTEELLNLADQALYQAKQTGRNRVVLATTNELSTL